MKKVLFIMVFCFAFLFSCAADQGSANPANADPASAEISFTFNRQSGSSSNQYAVWVEDSSGNFVKTLYATKYTANGGWERRPQSIPLWVAKSGLPTMPKKDIDAITAATPRTGTQSYRWDGTDKNGNRLAAGEYRIFLEATLRGENRVLYSAAVTLGNSQGIPTETLVTAGYFGSSTSEWGMIEDVRVVYRQ
ncbi:MAG: DUF2271 domain-containing protein [Treponema sp.]|jgi:hypothetical protein|nr:DUF2271 domain-containing protein [Treponema sp.]